MTHEEKMAKYAAKTGLECFHTTAHKHGTAGFNAGYDAGYNRAIDDAISAIWSDEYFNHSSEELDFELNRIKELLESLKTQPT